MKVMKGLLAFACGAVTLGLAFVSVAAQTTDLTVADKLANEAKWSEAEIAYRSATDSNVSNGQAWTGLGESQLQQHKYEEAQKSFQKALSLRYRPAATLVNLARVSASAGKPGEVFADFQQIISYGLGGAARPIILASPEFAELSKSFEFRKIVDEEMRPCRSDEFHRFDFWVGEWKVFDPAGSYIGDSIVTREQDGCLLVENWKSSRGAETGTSFNYFDIRDENWHQLYISNSGNAGAFPPMAGELQNGKMVLLTDTAVKPLARWTWYTLESNRVRQMAEQSQDDGKTWTTTWDSVYVRKQAPAVAAEK